MDISTLASCLPSFIGNSGSPKPPDNARVDVLILGAGWTATFLIPHLRKNHRTITYASTTRSGGGQFGSLPFEFDPENKEPDKKQWRSLPDAATVLITFPIKVAGASRRLVEGYVKSRKEPKEVNFIQLGSTGIYDGGPTLDGDEKKCRDTTNWIDRHSPYDNTNPRARSEDELLSLSSSDSFATPVRTTVLNLCGLYGGTRSMRNYVGKIAPSKEALAVRGSIHLIHGLDVSRAIIAVHQSFSKAAGERWILTDGRVYDWWDLASAWGEGGQAGKGNEEVQGQQGEWVKQLMREQNIRVLPRTADQLGRAMEAREFWETFELTPVRARVEQQ